MTRITEIPRNDAVSSHTEKLCKVSKLKEKKKSQHLITYWYIRISEI